MKRAVLRSLRPRDLGILAGTIWWLSVLPLLKRTLPLPRLVRLMWRPATGQARSPDREDRAIRLIARLCRVSGGNCLERSLILYRLLARGNASPRLVVALGRPGGELLGHVWVTVDGEPLLDSPAALGDYRELIVFGSDGMREPSSLPPTTATA